MWDIFRFFKKAKVVPKHSLQYTWNGLSPEIIRENWRPGDEYWVLVWWKNFNAQHVYYEENNKIYKNAPKNYEVINH